MTPEITVKVKLEGGKMPASIRPKGKAANIADKIFGRKTKKERSRYNERDKDDNRQRDELSRIQDRYLGQDTDMVFGLEE